MDLTQVWAVFNFGMVVLIWLVQLIIYPGMHAWKRSSFIAAHRSYTSRMGWIVGPLMVLQAILGLWLVLGSPGGLVSVQMLLLGCVWLTTIFCSIPMHRRLARGYDRQAVKRLIATNWLRTAGWSGVSLLDWVG